MCVCACWRVDIPRELLRGANRHSLASLGPYRHGDTSSTGCVFGHARTHTHSHTHTHSPLCPALVSGTDLVVSWTQHPSLREHAQTAAAVKPTLKTASVCQLCSPLLARQIYYTSLFTLLRPTFVCVFKAGQALSVSTSDFSMKDEWKIVLD